MITWTYLCHPDLASLQEALLRDALLKA
ncbi:protein of unknown function [Paraburkholderia dioscoreae]|uniref:Uncharacterized protein n=1 Tax=Paraburkholderia dioscoreae TaxID=2604047 RepID=A0A5Q4ZF23_9BURK|nr:protein of unknown function [Paraburkholderia dioscoreae]